MPCIQSSLFGKERNIVFGSHLLVKHHCILRQNLISFIVFRFYISINLNMYLSEYYYTIEGVDEIEDKIIFFFSFCDWIYVVCVVFRCWESYISSGVRTSIGNKSFTSDCWVFDYRNGFTTLRSTSHCL